MFWGLTSLDWMALAIFAGCVTASAFFSVSETAITSLGTLKVKHLINSRGRAVEHLDFWLHHPSRVLTTILIGNTLVAVLASAVATDFATRYGSAHAVEIATIVTTAVVLLFGEVIPKTLGKAFPEPIGLSTLKVIRILHWMVFPLVVFFSSIGVWTVRLIGRDVRTGPPITEEELEFLVNVGERSGVLEEMKSDMLSGVFEFDETRVREIMTPRPDMSFIDSKTGYRDVLKMVVECGHSRIPVYEGRVDNIVGILMVKDLLRFAADCASDFKITEIMRKPFFVPESKTINEVFKDLKSTKNHMAIIIDEYGGTAGLVTMEDILEEIVGEIQDEHDAEEAGIKDVDEKTALVAGTVNIEEFCEHFEVETILKAQIKEVQEEGIDTIGGWVTHLLEDMPRLGQKIELGPLMVEVTEVQRHRIMRLKIVRAAAARSAE